MTDSVEPQADDHGHWVDSGSGGGYEPRQPAQPPISHPRWCDPPSCTIDRPNGTHRSPRITVTASGDTLSLFVEAPHNRVTGAGLLFIEQRGCGCVGCEPTGVLLMPPDDAVAFLAAARTLIEDMTAVSS